MQEWTKVIRRNFPYNCETGDTIYFYAAEHSSCLQYNGMLKFQNLLLTPVSQRNGSSQSCMRKSYQFKQIKNKLLRNEHPLLTMKWDACNSLASSWVIDFDLKAGFGDPV